MSAGVAIAGLLGALLILGNRARMRFSVSSSQAVAEIVDRRVAAMGWLTLILGILARKPRGRQRPPYLVPHPSVHPLERRRHGPVS